jgi:hypothetical protein
MRVAGAVRRFAALEPSCNWSAVMSLDLLSIAGIASALVSGGFVVLLGVADDRLEHLVDWR